MQNPALLILLFPKDKRSPIVKVVSLGTSSSMRHTEICHEAEGGGGGIARYQATEEDEEEEKNK